ncbi:MAG TPA: DUF1772 domain-containing protein [Pseudonocardiaceae bacterium]
MIHVLLPLLLLANGMAAGGLMIALLGGAPLQFVLPVDSYVVVQQFLTTRFDPFMPICLVITILMDGTLAATTATSPFRWLAAIAGVLTASAISVSLTKNFPINKFVRKLDPANLPANWSEVDPRVRWRNWNAVRTTLTVAALLLNVTAVGTLI